MRGVAKTDKEKSRNVNKLARLLDEAAARERLMQNLARRQAKAFDNIKWLAAEMTWYLSQGRVRR